MPRRRPTHLLPDPPARRPLFVTADDRLLDDLLRLAAAAGVPADVAHDLGAARSGWVSASMVVVGEDVLTGSPPARPPRRPGVLLAGLDADDAGVWQRAVDLGAEQVVHLPDGQAELLDRLADAGEDHGRAAVLVAAIGGRGGAGATSLAVALALAGTRTGARTLLVDADPLGGGIDTAVGGEELAGVRWPELASSRGRVSGRALRDALPEVEALTVLSWDRGDLLTIPPDAMSSVLAAALRSHDLVVVDVPRRVDAAAEQAVTRARTVLLVVPAEVRASVAAARVAASVRALASDVRVVVRGPSPSRLPASIVAESLGLPLAADLPPEPELAQSLDRGDPPGRSRRSPLARFADDLVATLLAEREAA